MSTPDKLTGIAGSIKLAGASVSITKWKAKPKREMAKATDSSNYVPASTVSGVVSGVLWSSHLPGEIGMEFDVEGYWHLSTVPTQANVVAQIYAKTPIGFVLSFDETNVYCSGQCWLQDAEVGIEVEGAKTVEWSASLMVEGSITFGTAAGATVSP